MDEQKKEQWDGMVDRIFDSVDVITAKFTSGKFLFTVATAGVFVYAVVAKMLTPDQIMAIIMLVVGFYFNKTETGQETKTTETKITAETKTP